MIGYNLPPGTKAKVQAGAPGETAVPIDAGKFHLRGPINVLVTDLPESIPPESNDATNDTLQRATRMSAPGSAAGRIVSQSAGVNSEACYYRFDSKAGQKWIIETEAARRGSPIDTRIDVLSIDGHPIERVVLQAVRDSYINFRGIDSLNGAPRLKSYEEMELNQFIYMGGEVCKLFQAPRARFRFRPLPGPQRPAPRLFRHHGHDPCQLRAGLCRAALSAGNEVAQQRLAVVSDLLFQRRRRRSEAAHDSRLMFTAPADGSYVVRVIDSRGQAGERYVFRLTVRKPRPDFHVTLVGANPTVNTGSGQQFKVQADRLDYFDGDIRVDITGVPPGFTVTTPLVIQAGHLESQGVLYALEGARSRR